MDICVKSMNGMPVVKSLRGLDMSQPGWRKRFQLRFEHPFYKETLKSAKTQTSKQDLEYSQPLHIQLGHFGNSE